MCAILTGNNVPQSSVPEVSSAPQTSLWQRYNFTIQWLLQVTQVKHESTSTKTTYFAVHLNISHCKVNLLLIYYTLPFYYFRIEF